MTLLDITAETPRLLCAYGQRMNLTLPQMAYVLATVYHETGGRMEPVEEAYWLSDEARLAYLKSKSYYPYYGMGDVQITLLANYKKADADAAKEGLTEAGAIIANPELLLVPKVSAFLAVHGMKVGRFTGKRLSDYINSSGTDYYKARKIINVLDKAALVAGYAAKLETELASAGYGSTLDLSAVLNSTSASQSSTLIAYLKSIWASIKSAVTPSSSK